MRGRFWNGSQWVVQDHVMDNPIRTIVVGLVSTENMYDANGNFLDGDPYDRAADRTNPTYRRLRNNIRRMAHAGQPIMTVDANGNVTSIRPNTSIEPIFAENVEELLSALFAALHSINSANLASGAPAIHLPMDVEGDASPAMFSASYTVHGDRQWESSLVKSLLDDDSPGAPSRPDTRFGVGGDAAEMMRQQGPDRNLYTFRLGNHVRVRDMNAAAVRDSFGFTGTNATDANLLTFRNWLHDYRGDDSGVLGDMENSVPLIVRETATHYADSNNPFSPRIYVQTNRGVLHSINYVTGREEWAFIPPLAQNPFVRNKRLFMNNSFIQDNSDIRSRPMRILDGMLSRRHITDASGRRRTLMLGAMGMGGAGIYMMDITDPTLNRPNFLWGVLNPAYENQTGPSQLLRWGSAGTGSENDYRFYTWLGFTTSAPEIRRVMPEVTPAGVANYVGITPGGVGYMLGNPAYHRQGKAIIFFDVESGRYLRAIEDDTALLGSYIGPNRTGTDRTGNSQPQSETLAANNARLGMAIAPINYFNHPDGENGSTVGGTLREFFTSDSEGHILYSGILSETDQSGNITGVPIGQWRAKAIFRARNIEAANRGGPIAIPVASTLGRDTRGGGDRWLFSGTAPVEGPEGRSRIVNSENYIFALNLSNHPAYMAPGTNPQDMPSTRSPEFASVRQVRTLANLGRVQRERNTSDPLDPADVIPANSVREQHYGWLIRLRPPVAGNNPREGEYVSAPPFIFNGVLYVATFTPHSWANDDRERCDDTGDGRLYALNPTTGAPMWGHFDGNRENQQAHVFENVMITGISSFRGNLFLGVRPLTAGATHSFGNNEDTRSFTTHADGSIVEIEAVVSDSVGVIDEAPLVPHVQFWRETIIR
jgi:outer membrane protein assembly factor BamB